MQFLDLKSQYKTIEKEINEAIKGVLESSVFIGGKEVESFEKEIANFCGVKYAIGLNSGTDALYLALRALNIKEGDEVITSPFTFIATAEAISSCGAKPVFVDIDPKTLNIDPKKLEEKLSELGKLGKLKNVKAIIPVHIFGQMADMDEIMKIAKKYKLYVIEDAAQAIGASCKSQIKHELQSTNNRQIWRMAGSFGDFGCFSFFPSKNLGAYGDGGMIVTNSEDLADKIKLLRNHGSSPKEKYLNLVLGTNSRLDAIQAAILRVKLKYLNEWSKKRQEKASCYTSQLSELDSLGKLIACPYVAPSHTHTFHQYTIRVGSGKRDELKKFLTENNIPVMVYYPISLHLQPVMKYLGYKEGDLPESEKASKEVMSLPIYPELSTEEQDIIVGKIKEFAI
ncbi:MAG: DegT/DnrJ/EryC1/StrS family aminotransferase [Minisyncoccia bacterium]